MDHHSTTTETNASSAPDQGDPFSIPDLLDRRVDPSTDNGSASHSDNAESGVDVTSPTDDLTGTSGALGQFDEVADRITARMRRTAADIVATGRDLIAVKAQLKHGEFLAWIEAKLGMSDRAARNYMRVASWADGKPESVSDLPPTTLYLLAAPSTPASIRQEVEDRLLSGRSINPREIEQRVREARGQKRARNVRSKESGARPEHDSEFQTPAATEPTIEDRDCAERVYAVVENLRPHQLQLVAQLLARPGAVRALQLLIEEGAGLRGAEGAGQ